eukprot:3784090-Rhodomonas_salina.5
MSGTQTGVLYQVGVAHVWRGHARPPDRPGYPYQGLQRVHRGPGAAFCPLPLPLHTPPLLELSLALLSFSFFVCCARLFSARACGAGRKEMG